MRHDLIVIGGGIIGLSTAMETLRRFPRLRVTLVEKEPAIAMHQTGHNSGVIHSGIYYRPGSLKAGNCVEGAARMVDFCRSHDIPYEICGKVVVATDTSEVEGLHELLRRGTANGVPNLALIGPEQLRELEPHCAGVAALHVPGTGITDYSRVAVKYADLIQQSGGTIVTRCSVTGIRRNSTGMVIETTQGAMETEQAVNCAGLFSDRIMRMAGDFGGPKIVPFRGEYHDLAPTRQLLVRNLIYPVANPNFPFLGVHFTRRISGGIEAGPNAVLALKREGYTKTDFSLRDAMDTGFYPGFWKMARKYWANGMGEYYRSLSKRAFTRALQKLVPEIDSADLAPGGAGVRAQALGRNGSLLDDFAIIQSERMIHVCNVPSPAATASLPIGQQITDMMSKAFGLR